MFAKIHMFLDLCVDAHWKNAEDKVGAQRRQKMLQEAKKLGFRGLCWNVCVEGEKQALASHILFPPSALPEEPESDSLHIPNQYNHINFSSFTRDTSDPQKLNAFNSFLQLRRITIQYSSVANLQPVNNFIRQQSTYDLVVVKPSDEKTWTSATQSVDCDIIQLELSQPRTPYPLKRAVLNSAIHLGEALKSQIARRSLFTHLHTILRFVPFEKIIFTTGASEPLKMRSPDDLCALINLCGFGDSFLHCRKFISTNCMAALYSASYRRAAGPVHLSHV